jgi:hypothetical protein
MAAGDSQQNDVWAAMVRPFSTSKQLPLLVFHDWYALSLVTISIENWASPGGRLNDEFSKAE